MAGITSGSLNKVHLRPTVSTEKTGREVPRHRERLLWPRGRGAGGGDSLALGHTHLRVHVVPRVDAGILRGRGARQPSGPAPPRARPGPQCAAHSASTWGNGEGGPCPPLSPSAPPSLDPEPSSIPCPSVCRLQFFPLDQPHHNRDSQHLLREHPAWLGPAVRLGGGRPYHHAHFTEEETEGQRGRAGPRAQQARL